VKTCLPPLADLDTLREDASPRFARFVLHQLPLAEADADREGGLLSPRMWFGCGVAVTPRLSDYLVD
jgi:hypothetical protein